MSKEIVRSAVDRRAMQSLLEHYEEAQHQHIVNAIFSTPWRSSSSTYLVRRPEIKTVDDIRRELGRLEIDSEQLVGDILSLIVIKNDLTPPASIVELFQTKEPIAVFTGAGVSRLLGVPAWKELAWSGIEFLEQTYDFSNQESEYLKAEFLDPKALISVFHRLVKKYARRRTKLSFEDTIKQFYQRSLSAKSRPKDFIHNPYYHLCRLECVKITTNIENEFGTAYKQYMERSSYNSEEEGDGSKSPPTKVNINQICVADKDWSDPFILEKESIYHIHGVLEKPDSLIMTSEDYVNTYYREPGRVVQFLESLAKNYTIVFIGYSLSEYELIGRIIRGDKRHFALLPINSSQVGEFPFQIEYFDPFNITPVPYFTDKSGYDRLTTVLSFWADYINEKLSKPFLDDQAILEEAVK